LLNEWAKDVSVSLGAFGPIKGNCQRIVTSNMYRY